jgi:cytochrome P450
VATILGHQDANAVHEEASLFDLGLCARSEGARGEAMRSLALGTSSLVEASRTACMTDVPDAGELPDPAGPSRTPVSFYWWTYCAALASVVLLAAGLLHVALRVHSGLLAVPLSIALLLGHAVSRRVRELHAYRDLPGPRPSFFLGNLRSLLSCGHGGRDRALLELHRAYGPIVRLHMAWGSAPFVSVSRVSENLRRKDVDSNRRADRTLLPRSLMGLLHGETHRRHRHELGPYFTPRAARSGAGRMAEVSRLYLETWHCGRTRHGSLKADLHHWSAHSLGVFLAGKDWAAGEDLSHYLDAIASLEEVISTRTFHPFFVRWLLPRQRGRGKAAYRYLCGLFSDLLARRERESDAGEDVLGHLVRLRDRWSRAERVEEMISLVAGGTDAMSATVAQALVLLSQHPTIQDEARAQVAALAPGTPPPPLLLHVIAETVRLYPPVPFSSKVSPRGGVVELGYHIPAGTNIMWMKTAVGRDAANFHDPERFEPRRFVCRAESMAQALPFGAGPRHCIGRGLAEINCASLLAAILLEFDVVPAPVEDVTFTATVSVTPSAVPVRLVPRLDARPPTTRPATATTRSSPATPAT